MTINNKKKRIKLTQDLNRDSLIPPNLIDIQIASFKSFLKKGIKEELENISPIIGYGGKLELEFLSDYVFEEPK